MTKLPLQHNIKIHAHGGHFGNLRRISIGRMRIDRKPASTPRKPCDHAACPPLRSFSTIPGTRGQTALGRPSFSSYFGLGFEAQPRNPVVLWPNHCKPRVQTSVVSRYPALASLLRLHLALLATMRPALDLVGHRVPRTKPTRPLHSSEVTQTQTFRTCSSPAPTQIKPQPASAVLGQESVHTTLSITHH